MAYDKMELQAAGVKVVELVVALSDGADMDDLDEGVALLTALSGVAGAIQEDLDAALLDIVSGAASAAADLRRGPAVPA